MEILTADQKLNIRPAQPEDLPKIMEIFQAAKSYMRSEGNLSQWNGAYPDESLLLEDMEKQQLFVICKDYSPCAVFAFIIGEDPTYELIEDGQWLSPQPYGTIHRIASNGTVSGILNCAVDFCWNKISHLRVDTHKDNITMQRAILRNGFQKCGIIYISDGSPRIAYEKI